MAGEPNEMEALWCLHQRGQIDATQQNLLCTDNAAYNAFVNGAFHRIKRMQYRMPIFWYEGREIWVIGFDGKPELFPVWDMSINLHEQYLEMMNDEILAASRAGRPAYYEFLCQAIAELITARERYFADGCC